MDDDSFSFLKKIPSELTHPIYCPQCFDEKVSAPLADYNSTMEKAKDVIVFFKNEGKKTRLLPRKEQPLEVIDCLDENETVLRLAFFAAQGNFNSIIDVEIKSEKVINGSHKYSKWRGTAMPCLVDEKFLKQDYYD
jgi:hypothetical protein